ncbi:hypothetical protein, partial [Photobacterium damselae]|uniref:hypothetical protein n=1 Tax=Photobacterium damselae TaxID=38293 RepID=UPI001C40A1BC
DKLIESRHIPLVVIVMTKSLGNYDTTESLGDHTELAMIASSLLDKTLLDSQLYSGWLILGKVLVTCSQSTSRVQKDRHCGRSFNNKAIYVY